MTEEREGRSKAEWTTFIVACLILLFVVGLIVAQIIDGQAPAAPVAEQKGEVRKVGDRFHVPVVVRNEGGETAENVQVVASLEIGEDTVEADQTVDFLSGKETEEVEFVFEDDPASGKLEITVSGYSIP